MKRMKMRVVRFAYNSQSLTTCILHVTTWCMLTCPPVSTLDPNNAKLRNANESQRRESDLRKQMAQEQLERELLNTKLDAKWKSHLTNFKTHVEELEKKIAISRATQRNEIIAHGSKHLKALKKRESEELQNLAEKNQLETTRINAKYTQYCDQSGNLTPQMMQMMQMESQNHSQKINEVKNNLDNKLKELLAESDSEQKKKCLKLDKHHHRRRADVRTALNKLRNNCQSTHQLLKAKIMKDHKDKYERLSDMQSAKFPLNEPKTPKDAPIGGKNNTDTISGAAVRLKLRIMHQNRSHIPARMTVEIHNEGLIVSLLNENTTSSGISESRVDPKTSNNSMLSFIPWGYAARSFLFSITCGEIPDHSIVGNSFNSHSGLQGQLKAFIADMRVSASNAASQWKLLGQEVSIDNLTTLEQSIKTRLKSDVSIETLCNEEMKTSCALVEKAEHNLTDLRNKTLTYVNSDGSKRESTSDENYAKVRQILGKGVDVVKNAEKDQMKNGHKMALARAKRIQTTETYKQILQQLSDAKKTPHNDQPTNEVSGDEDLSEFLSVFYKVAAERRSSQINEHAPKSQKKCKQVSIVLRNPQNSSKEARLALQDSEEIVKNKDESMIRVEQLLLLSMHPCQAPDEKLSGSPPNAAKDSTAWGEPGWHLDLDVSREGQDKCSILQSPPVPNKSFDYLHCEHSSSQGHQIASLVGSQHMLALCTQP